MDSSLLLVQTSVVVIIAICGQPELDDTTSYLYREGTKKKDFAWIKVSEDCAENMNARVISCTLL